MKKSLVFSVIIFFFIGRSLTFGQEITMATVDAGPFTPGSSIAGLFSTAAATNLRPGNIFELYLSDAAGNFRSTDAPIGIFDGFYSTFVNGTIPMTTPEGIGYRLKVKAKNLVTNSPEVTSSTSSAFEIKLGVPLTAKLSNRNLLNPAFSELFGFCSGKPNFNYNLENESTADAEVSVLVTNELTGAVAPVIIFTQTQTAKTFLAQEAHYTVLAKAEKGGTVGTRAYMIVNNRALTAFGTTGTSVVCLGGDALEFNVLVSGGDGIINNYPGTTYKVDWGDNSNHIYTLKDITENNNKVDHSYLTTACGDRIDLGATTIYNAFGISVFAHNQYCGAIGTPISTFAKVSVRPVNNFIVPSILCTKEPSVFVNNSTIGENPEGNAPKCVPNVATFTWYVDGEVVPGAIDKPKSFSLIYQFRPGNHSVTIESTSNAPCPPIAVTKEFCIQNPAKPSFTLNGTNAGIAICSSTMVTPVNTSVVDNSSCGTNTYTWSISPATYTLANNSTLTSATPPQINFTAGVYKIKLTINAQRCGEVVTPEQTVIVSELPTTVLSADVILCNYTAYDFNLNSEITKTEFGGTPDEAIVAETYTWEVFGGDVDFVGSTKHSKFPKIRFKEFKAYTIKVTHKNICGTSSDTQVITFRPSPILEAGTYAVICYDSSVQLDAQLLTGYTPRWVGGTDAHFSTNRNDPRAIYTPTTEERDLGHIDLKWQITTALDRPCDEVFAVASIDIEPRNLMTSGPVLILCSEALLNYTNLSTIAGSTFTWTATQSGGVTGMLATGSGAEITDMLVNTNPATNAIVTYHITPTFGVCTGEPFDLVVTLTPRPVINASAPKLSICTGESVAISVSSNLPATYQVKYIYTATASIADITGFSSNPSIPAALTSINDVLENTGVSAGTVTYQITSISETGCVGTTQIIVITVNPLATIASAGADETICSNIAYPLAGNIPNATETGKWTLISGLSAIFADATKYNTTVSGLQGGQSYTLRWTISTPAGCSTFDDVIITNLPELGTINISASTLPVCLGQEVTITGESPTGGNGQYTYAWESSLDDGVNWLLIPGEIGPHLTLILNASTSYRRITQGGICKLASNILKIIMLQPLGSNTISSDQSICLGSDAAAFLGSIPTGGNGEYLYQWQMSVNGGAWVDIVSATSSDFTPSLLAATTSFRRVLKTNICTGYAESESNVVTVTIKPNAKAEYSFQQAEGCAPFGIDALNIKAVPYSDRNAVYTWYVKVGAAPEVMLGEGINFPGYIIPTDKSIVKFRLVVTSSLNCSIDETEHTFQTFENVKASYVQNKVVGCGPLLVDFSNTSNIRNGVSFKWDFGNGKTSESADPGNVTFLQDPTGKDVVYHVTLNARTECGNSEVFRSTVTIHSTPVSVFSPGSTVGCSPLPVTFVNISSWGFGTTFTYNFGDGSPAQTYTDKQDVFHEFIAIGETKFYTIRMTARNECGEHFSEHTISITPKEVFAELVVDAAQKQGCAPWTVEFENNSGNATSYVYDWGDGTKETSNTAPEKIKHTFIRPGTYTVTLLVKNSCSDASTTETIIVLEQPATRFTVNEKVGFPGLKLKFTDASSGAIKYKWEFGDGASSTEKDPVHAFNDLGTYKVKLTSYNVENCSETYAIEVFITGEPGSLFLPNSFVPGSPQLEFREFKAKGTGILSWRMSIFDKWGAKLWETNKLDDGKPVEGWDGTHRGQAMPQGVYYWKIDLQLRNGSDWKGITLNSSAAKRTGTINLIR